MLENPGAPVVVRFEKDFVAGETKSSVMPDEVEMVESGGVVAFYNAETGRLDSQYRVDDLSSPMSLMLQKGRMNVYVLGNIWLIGNDGRTCEPSFPLREKDLESMSYRFGAVPAGDGLRTESFSEIGKYGIPVKGVMRDVDITSGVEIKVGLERMFAKVRITVDHGGMSSVDGQFRNETIYFRQANSAQMPFAPEGSAALSAGDLMGQSDYEAPMQDGSRKSYTFYIPENRHRSPAPDLATYVEFAADVDRSAGGFGGGVTYRFYLGKSSGRDNDLEGNVLYDIVLTFKVGSLFEPSWRVNPDNDFSDGRLFCVMKDNKFSSILGTQDVVVRAGRPGKVYVYMNRNGETGKNHLLGRPMTDSFVPSGLADCAWTGDFTELAKCGISATWDASAGRLSMEVTDRSKFVAGRRIPVRLRLLPGAKSVVMNVLTGEEQALKLDCSEFYMGMKRTATVSGFAGKGRYVRVKSENHLQHFRLSDEPSALCIGKTPVPFSGNSVDLYAWNYSETEPVTLIFESDDSFNDDALATSFQLWRPVFRKDSKMVRLRLDGTGSPVDYGFNDRKGKAMSSGMFSPKLYDKLLAPKVQWTDGVGDLYAGFSSGEFYIDYFGRSGQSDWIGNQVGGPNWYAKGYISLGVAVVSPKSPLYFDSSSYVLDVYYPHYTRAFPETVRTSYLNEYRDSEIDLNAEFDTCGNKVSFTAESGTGAFKLNLRETRLGNDVSGVSLNMGENVDLSKIPGGPSTFFARVVNPRIVSGDKEIFWRSTVNIYHEMTIAPFGVFSQNSPILNVYLTYPKAAWMLKKYYEKQTSSFPAWNMAGEMNAYDRYISWTRKYTVAKNSQSTTSSTGDKVMVMYCDLFPSGYPVQENWTAGSAATAASKQWLTELCFKSGGAGLSQPLPSSSLGGNSFYRITSSTSPIGWVYENR
ncbi:MAG: hypothetical protein MJY89_00490 [Bacteroidales bacterium]|nr:hypothetical protein [Bacteroidales bacterium]